MQCLEQVNIGTLSAGVFPADDGKIYIYKRPNGHIYVYSNGSEKHICCEDGLISEVPVFTDLPSVTPPTHLPNTNRRFLFVKDDELYFYNKDKVATKVNTNTIVTFNINNW